jgi:alanine racemase
MTVADPERLLARLRPARARIDLDRLAANYHAIATHANRPVMPVVKADAYGHGAAHVARRLVVEGAPVLAVAYPEEGAALREAGVKLPIVVLTGFAPGQETVVIEYDLTPVVSTPETLDLALATAAAARRRLTVHLKVDTGMGRLGFPLERIEDAAARLAGSGRVELAGLMTHLACADEDAAFTEKQLDRFDQAVAQLAARGLRPRHVHAANSAGLAFLRPTHTLVRPGLLLYGVRPRPLSPDLPVQPVMSLSARIALVKEVPAGTTVSYGARWVAARPSRVATIPLGYADGVPRTRVMSETGVFVARGERIPIAGTVCMDLTMADVTDHPAVDEGDEAVLFGDAPGAWEVAECAGTNAWDVLTSVGGRVPRVYVEGGRVVAVQAPCQP